MNASQIRCNPFLIPVKIPIFNQNPEFYLFCFLRHMYMSIGAKNAKFGISGAFANSLSHEARSFCDLCSVVLSKFAEYSVALPRKCRSKLYFTEKKSSYPVMHKSISQQVHWKKVCNVGTVCTIPSFSMSFLSYIHVWP